MFKISYSLLEISKILVKFLNILFESQKLCSKPHSLNNVSNYCSAPGKLRSISPTVCSKSHIFRSKPHTFSSKSKHFATNLEYFFQNLILFARNFIHFERNLNHFARNLKHFTRVTSEFVLNTPPPIEI